MIRLKPCTKSLKPVIIFLSTCIILISRVFGNSYPFLNPNQIGIIINQGSAQSRIVGHLYSDIRKVPPTNQIYVDCPSDKAISRKTYELCLEKPVQKFLKNNKKIQCLLTTSDIPRFIIPTPGMESDGLTPYRSDAATVESELMNCNQPFKILSGWKKRKKGMSGKDLVTFRLDGAGPVQIREALLGGLRAEKSGLRGSVCVISDPKDGKFLKFNSWLGTLPAELPDLEIIKTNVATRNETDYCDSTVILISSTKGHNQVKWVDGALFLTFGENGFKEQKISTAGHDCKNAIGEGALFCMDSWGMAMPNSYPDPSEFLSIVLTGHLTMGDIIRVTAPVSSWLITFWGDPLYQPFAAHPQLLHH